MIAESPALALDALVPCIAACQGSSQLCMRCAPCCVVAVAAVRGASKQVDGWSCKGIVKLTIHDLMGFDAGPDIAVFAGCS